MSEDEQVIESPDEEDPEVLAEQAKATEELKEFLKTRGIEVDYVEADWKDAESLILDAADFINKHKGWSVEYINGDMLGIDSNYVFFTSKPVEGEVVMKIAELVVNEGAELPESFAVRCPNCNMELEMLAGSCTASVPMKAMIVNDELYVDYEEVRISDLVDYEGLENWECPNCDAVLFTAEEQGPMTEFLKTGIYPKEFKKAGEPKEAADEGTE